MNLEAVSEVPFQSAVASENARTESTQAKEYAVAQTEKSLNTAIENHVAGLDSGYGVRSNPYNISEFKGLSGNENAKELASATTAEEEKAKSIWMPEAYARNNSGRSDRNPNNRNDTDDQQRKRERPVPGNPNIDRGNGASGKIFESESYKTAFGYLSSF